MTVTDNFVPRKSKCIKQVHSKDLAGMLVKITIRKQGMRYKN